MAVAGAVCGVAALLLLILVGNAESGGSVVGEILPWAGLAGILSVGVNAAWPEAAGREIVELNVAVWTAAVTGMLAVRQMLTITRRGGGMNIEQLWRLVAVQWALLAAGAEVYFRWTYRHEGIAASQNARSVLFLLPALAVLPNVMMAVGIRLWGARAMGGEKPPRCGRGWWRWWC